MRWLRHRREPTEIQRQATLAASFNKPFWLQLVGTGISTAFAAHLGSVLSQAQLLYITTSELWEHDLLKTRLEVTDGYMPYRTGRSSASRWT